MAAAAEELTSWRQNMSKNKLHTLARLGQDEVALIWSHVSDFVLRQMLQQKGVHIPAFGTFTFMRQKLDVGNKFIVTQKPLFLMAEKLLQLHGLSQNKVYTPGDIPIVPLNFVTISMAGPYNRETVEGCVKETLQLLSRSICTKKKIEFTFQGIGVLIIEKEKIKMKFFKEFLSGMDKSGNPKKDSTNRPQTMDSVISHTQSTRKRPDTVLIFPRIDFNLKGKHPTVEKVEEIAPPRPRKSILMDKPEKPDKADKPEDIKVNFIPRPPGEKPVPVPPSVVPFTWPVKMEQDKTAKGTSPKSVPSVPASKKEPEAKPKTSETPTCKDHVRAGQEMCYVCMQRAQGNIPMTCRQAQKWRDIEDDLTLQSYQLMKDREALFKDQLRMKAERKQNMRNAAYNLGVADAMKAHKNQKCQFEKFYIFGDRPASAAIVAAKEREHSQNLLRQIDCKREKALQERENQLLMDQLELMQLQEEIEEQRHQVMKDKFDEREVYKRALEVQLRNRPFRLPTKESVPASPIFGKEENIKTGEKREQNVQLRQMQVEAAEDQKRSVILQQIKTQARDMLLLQRSNELHLAERCAEEKRRREIKKSLLKEWDKDIVLKKQRDAEAKAFDKAADKLFILDQCKDYKRCKQCQRDPSNKGKSNFWPYNKNLPGSHMLQ